MKRFCRNDQKPGTGRGKTLRGVAGSVAIFGVVMLLFLHIISKTAEKSVKEQQRYLEEAVAQSLLQCYVTEGGYPESFSYLEEKYGLVYDKEHFRVDYRVYGSNLYPEVKVLVLKE